LHLRPGVVVNDDKAADVHADFC